MKDIPQWQHAGYLCRVIRPKLLRETIAEAVKELKPYVKEFDCLAFRGLSGTIPGVILAYKLRRQMVIVRKGEQAHSSYLVEGNKNVKSYLLIDDCVDSGATVCEIIKAVDKLTEGRAQMYGSYLTCSLQPFHKLGDDSSMSRRFETHAVLYQERVKNALEAARGI